jgi:regulator of replication initiation timing
VGQIYIAWDRSKPNLSKVGMTTRTGYVRILEADNPDYELFKAYDIHSGYVAQMEKEVHAILETKFIRRSHKSYDIKSEWFECTPHDAQKTLDAYLGIDQVGTIKRLKEEVDELSQQNTSLISENQELELKLKKAKRNFTYLKAVLTDLVDFDYSILDSASEYPKEEELSKRYPNLFTLMKCKDEKPEPKNPLADILKALKK